MKAPQLHCERITKAEWERIPADYKDIINGERYCFLGWIIPGGGYVLTKVIILEG